MSLAEIILVMVTTSNILLDWAKFFDQRNRK